MVETVNAQTLLQGASGSSSQSSLEPGTELKAKVEANLSGGVVRLTTDSGKIDLRVPNPLPVGVDVSVTVAGTKQNPVIQITSTQSPDNAAQQAQQTVKPPNTSAPLQGPAAAQNNSVLGGMAASVRPSPVLANLLQPGTSSLQPPAPVTGTSGQQNPLPGSALPATGAAMGGGADGKVASSILQAGRPLPAPGALPLASGVTSSGAKAPPVTQTSGAGPTVAGGNNQVSTSAGKTTGTLQTPQVSGSFESGTTLPSSAASTQNSASQPSGTSSIPPTQSSGAAGRPTVASGITPQLPNGSATSSTLQTPPNTSATGPVTSQAQGTGPQSAAGQVSTGPLAASGPQQTAAGPVLQGNQPSGPPTVSSPAPGQSTAQTPLPATDPRIVTNAPTSSTAPRSGGQSLGQGSPVSSSNPGASSASQTPASVPGQVTLDTGRARVEVSNPPVNQGSQATRAVPAQPYPVGGGATPPSSASSSPGLPPPSDAHSEVARAASVLKGALGEQQAGLGGLFAQVGTLSAAQATGKVSLPDPVVKAMQQILGLRLNSSQLPTGQDIQQSVRLSGQFREAQLAMPQGRTQPLPDLKSMLLSFKSLLQQLGAEPQVSRPAGQPAMPSLHGGPQGQPQQLTGGFLSALAQQNLQSLLKDTDQALARIRLTQLVNSGVSADEGPQSTSRPMDLVVELPLSLGQETAVLQMQIGRDGGGSENEDEDEQAWRLRFSLDLTATGPLEAAISLRGGGTYASLWVDRKETFDNLKAVQETMEAAFADAGLDLQELRLIRGLPPKTAAKYGSLINRQS